MNTEHNSTEYSLLQAADISELTPGVTLVTGPFSALSIQVQHVLTTTVATASSELPIPMPTCDSVTVIHSGSFRQIEVLKCIHARLGSIELVTKTVKFEYRQAPTPLNLTSPEMVQCFSEKLKRLNNACFLLVMGEGLDPIDQGLMELRRLGELNNTYFIVICPGVTLHNKHKVVVNEVLVVNPVEPDPEFEQAFTIACPDLSSSFNSSLGKVICNTRAGEYGLEAAISPYVSDDVSTRLMAILRANDWSMQEIADLFEINKSNVSRKLRNVIGISPEGWGEEMFAQWKIACGIDLENIPVDEDSGEDDESPEAVAVDSTALKNSRNRRNKRNAKKKLR